MTSFQISLGSQFLWRPGLNKISCMDPFRILKQVPIYSSCLRECCNHVWPLQKCFVDYEILPSFPSAWHSVYDNNIFSIFYDSIFEEKHPNTLTAINNRMHWQIKEYQPRFVDCNKPNQSSHSVRKDVCLPAVYKSLLLLGKVVVSLIQTK